MSFLNLFKIRTKMLMLLVLSAGALVAVIGLSGMVLYNRMFDDRIQSLRAITEATIGIANALEEQVKAGKLTREQALDRFRESVHGMKYNGGKDYMIAFTMEGISIANGANPKNVGTSSLNNLDVNGKPIVGSMIDLLKTKAEGTVTYDYPKPGTEEPLPKTTFVKKFVPWNAMMGTGVWTDDIDAAFKAQLVKLGLIGLAVIAVSSAAFFLISTNITGSLGRLRAKMERLADGDFTVEVEEAVRKDEVGDMGRAVQVFKDNGLKNQALQAEMEENRRREEAQQREQEARDRAAEDDRRRLADEARAAEDRRQREQEAAERQKKEDAEKAKTEAEAQRHRDMLALADKFESAVGGIVESVAQASGQMRTLAEGMVGAVDRTNSQATAVAGASEQASANVQTVAAATEELSASLGEINRQVQSSTRIASEAVAQANTTNTQVEQLTEAAKRIGEIVSMIQDIASQTNLLALNATIEAARAGEAGKGFAVVASEVKTLANQTAKATGDISAQVAAIQTSVGEAATSIRSVGQTIDQINQIASIIASAVTEQGAATQEITASIQQAASGTQEVSSNIAGVSQIASETRSSAGQVLGAAGDLSKQADLLRAEVSRFVQQVRAA